MEKLRINVRSSDMSSAHCMGLQPKSQAEDRRLIVIKFCRREMKQEIISVYKRTKPEGLFINKILPRPEVGSSIHCGKPNDYSKTSLPAMVPMMEKFMCTSSRQTPVQVMQGTQKSQSILRNNFKSFVYVHLRLKVRNLSMTEVYTKLTMLYWRKVIKVCCNIEGYKAFHTFRSKKYVEYLTIYHYKEKYSLRTKSQPHLLQWKYWSLHSRNKS